MRKVRFTEKVAKELLNRALRFGGATVGRNGEPYTGTGFAVSKDGHELKVPVRMASVSLIREWVKQLKLDDDDYIGAWIDEGYLYLDVSRIIPDKEEALITAKLWRQKAIYDFETGQSIYV